MNRALARRRFLQIAAASALVPAAAQASTWRGVALGADVEITLHGRGAGAVLPDIVTLLRRTERLFSLYDPRSALSRLNRKGVLDAPPEMQALLADCDTAHEVTHGLFDPTVQALYAARAAGLPPPMDRIGWRQVQLGPQVRLGPGQALTLNGIAQGFATDRVRDLLAARGFERALVHVGEFAALGGPWHLEIQDPALALPVTLRGRARATSTAAPHLFHPQGGAPLWSTISVEAASATWADALSTACLFAARPEIIRIFKTAPGQPRALLIDRSGEVTTL